jgi:hypothetical protein
LVARRRTAVPRTISLAIGIIAFGLAMIIAVLTYRLTLQRMRQNTAMRPQWLKHDGPIARVDELHGHGTIYLVQLTPHKETYSVDDLAHWLRTRYGLDARTLPPEAVSKFAWNG